MADKYYIGENIKKHAAHHESFKALWETKWQKPVGDIVPLHAASNTISSVAWGSTLSCSARPKILSRW
jgi:hypothetical protein